ncbi:hypothetical protein [Actinoplanes xinjiangensis]|uniref:hypothetical protein n=1 Tax=Actinoplanes xinjiangensis TaxID=512350 RepID=UPI00341BEA01
MLRSRNQATALVQRAHDWMAPLMTDLITRAVHNGQLPAGTAAADFAAVHVMVGSVMATSPDLRPPIVAARSHHRLACLRHADPPDEAVIDHLYNEQN